MDNLFNVLPELCWRILRFSCLLELFFCIQIAQVLLTAFGKCSNVFKRELASETLNDGASAIDIALADE